MGRWEQRRCIRIFIGILGVISAVGLGFAFSNLRAQWAMQTSTAQLANGFAQLAAETLDAYRENLIKTQAGCQSLISTYSQAGRADRLEWAAQACLFSRVELPEAYLAWSKAEELKDNFQGALLILKTAEAKFSASADIEVSMARIFRKLKYGGQTASLYLKAVQLAPKSPSLALEAIGYFSDIGNWKVAAELAENLIDVSGLAAEHRFLIARAFAHSGSSSASGNFLTYANASRALLVRENSDIRTVFESKYAELLKLASFDPQSVAALPNAAREPAGSGANH